VAGDGEVVGLEAGVVTAAADAGGLLSDDGGADRDEFKDGGNAGRGDQGQVEFELGLGGDQAGPAVGLLGVKQRSVLESGR
jgi:hypothetical protein